MCNVRGIASFRPIKPSCGASCIERTSPRVQPLGPRCMSVVEFLRTTRAEIRPADETERPAIILERRVCGPEEKVWSGDLVDRLELLVRKNYESRIRGRERRVVRHQARKSIRARRVSERHHILALARLSGKVHDDLLAVSL